MGQNRGRGGSILTTNELVLSLGGSYVCANLVKIDQEIRGHSRPEIPEISKLS